MPSLIHELENNEALLLMYLADELPPEDRAEVESMLAADAGLRAALAGIQDAYEASLGALARLDQDRTAEPAENHAVRQASRAMKQWQVDRLARQPVLPPAPRTRVPVWAYPIGVAAMLVICSLIWWGGRPDATEIAANPQANSNVIPPDAPVAPPEVQARASQLENSFNSFNDTPSGVADAETQASSLMARSDDESIASSIFMKEENQ